MKPFFFILAAVLILTGCNNQPSEAEESKTLSDSLFEAVMEGHDVAMPKMPKLERLQKETKTALDSIAKLPAAKRNQLASYKTALDSTLKALDYGDLTMTQWMNEFKYDSFKNNEQERAKYLQSELEKVNRMKDAVLNSLALADSVLAK